MSPGIRRICRQLHNSGHSLWRCIVARLCVQLAWIDHDQLIVTQKPLSIGKKVVPRLHNTKHIPRYTRTCYSTVAHNPAVTVPFSSQEATLLLVSTRVFVSYSQPIRFARFDGKAVNRVLELVLDQPRGRNSWCWPKGVRHLGQECHCSCNVNQSKTLYTCDCQVTSKHGQLGHLQSAFVDLLVIVNT